MALKRAVRADIVHTVITLLEKVYENRMVPERALQYAQAAELVSTTLNNLEQGRDDHG